MKKLALILMMMCTSMVLCAQTAVGEWADHNSYVSVRHVCAAPQRVYAATRMSMFYYDKADKSATPLTKVGGLSDVGISTFAYDEGSGCMVIAYTNSAVDLLADDEVYHISDIKNSSISGDKKIYHVRFQDNKAYLATGFGLVVLDLRLHEIRETFYLGPDGGQGAVYDVAFADTAMVAATDDGLLYAPRQSEHLNIFDSWRRDTLSPLKHKSVRVLEVNGQSLVAAVNVVATDSIDSVKVYYQRMGGWDSLPTAMVTSLRCRHGRTMVCGFRKVDIYDADFRLLDSMTDLPYYGMTVRDVDMDEDGTLWMGHSWAGLLDMPQGSAEACSHAPKGPFNDDNVFSLHATYDALYLCPGGKMPTYQGAFLEGNLHTLTQGEWEQLDFGDVGKVFQDVVSMSVDPTDRQHISAAAWGYGIVDIRNNTVQALYNKDNTEGVLVPFDNGAYNTYRVGAVAFDNEGNLWMTNSMVDHGLVVRYKDGSWKSFNTSAAVRGRELDMILWDSINGYKWFAGHSNSSNSSNIIYVHDGKDRFAYVNPNNGSKLETHTVNCLAQDHHGDIWFGTDKGIKVIYDGYRAFNNGGNGGQAPVSCSNILINQDGFYEYLMAYENVACIAVDGANRKWVGTSNNGLYLISDNGLEEIHHFTMANSPLASNKIVTLAVHPESGIVYVGTDKGLQSYRSTATEAFAEPLPDIHAFPNPVRPDYDGPIAIKGFTRDALVHITDARGHTVYSTTANGGQAIWDGRNQSGERVASGPYFVFASDANGAMRSVTKILIVR